MFQSKNNAQAIVCNLRLRYIRALPRNFGKMALCKELQKMCYSLVNARKGLPTQLGPWGVLASKTVWKRGGEGVAKGSMFGPVFFNVYLDFFVCIRKASAYNFC